MVAQDSIANPRSQSSIDCDDILLDAGTNEAEILVFRVGDQYYGVNVAKVREVHTIEQTTFLPRFPESVDGVIRVREAVVPAVDLHRYLWGESPEPNARDDRHLLLEFNNRLIAFRVCAVDRVHRVSWEAIHPVPHGLGFDVPMTGIFLLEDNIILVLDFESIGVKLGLSGGLNYSRQAASETDSQFTQCPLIVADDSALIRNMLRDALEQAGYENVQVCEDGQEAWECLQRIAEENTPESLHESLAALVTDVEMPRMDGFRLTKEIREHPILKDLPVILFSSLVSKDNEKKGRQVGATAQISKPKYDELSSTLVSVLESVISQ